MRTVAGAFIIAIVLFLVGAVCLSEARVMRRLAADQQRLSTLQYDDDEGAGSETRLVDRLRWPFASAASVKTQRAALNYWKARYELLTPLTGATGDAPASDPDLLLMAANATFRASTPEAGNTRASIDRLDSVMQAYGDVLRADPDNIDAAYNYEYVARVRDALAKGRLPGRGGRDGNTGALSGDLPAGPTLHGRPGGPPPDVPMSGFKTFSPLQKDERGDLMQMERTRVPRGRG